MTSYANKNLGLPGGSFHGSGWPSSNAPNTDCPSALTDGRQQITTAALCCSVQSPVTRHSSSARASSSSCRLEIVAHSEPRTIHVLLGRTPGGKHRWLRASAVASVKRGGWTQRRLLGHWIRPVWPSASPWLGSEGRAWGTTGALSPHPSGPHPDFCFPFLAWGFLARIPHTWTKPGCYPGGRQ